MTRRDYQLIAETIDGLAESPEARLRIAKAFAIALHGTNPNFQPIRFMEWATGVSKK